MDSVSWAKLVLRAAVTGSRVIAFSTGFRGRWPGIRRKNGQSYPDCCSPDVFDRGAILMYPGKSEVLS